MIRQFEIELDSLSRHEVAGFWDEQEGRVISLYDDLQKKVVSYAVCSRVAMPTVVSCVVFLTLVIIRNYRWIGSGRFHLVDLMSQKCFW